MLMRCNFDSDEALQRLRFRTVSPAGKHILASSASMYCDTSVDPPVTPCELHHSPVCMLFVFISFMSMQDH